MMTAALRSMLAHMKLHRPLGEVYSPFKLTPLTLGAWSAAHALHYSTLVRNLYLPDRQNWRQGSVESKPFAHAHGGSLADHMPSLT
jgi:hypothetical protein